MGERIYVRRGIRCNKGRHIYKKRDMHRIINGCYLVLTGTVGEVYLLRVLR